MIVVDKLNGKVHSFKDFLRVNIKNFGGVGDGTTDNTAAFNAAIAYLISVGGGELFFPAGVYCISGATTAVPGGVWLRGTGYDYHTPTGPSDRPSKMSVIRATAAMARLIQLGANGTGTSSAAGNTGASIFKLVVDGNGFAGSTVRTAARRNRIMKSEIYGGINYTIEIAGQNTTVEDCVVSGEGLGNVIGVIGFTDHKILDNQIRQSATNGACIRVAVSKVLIRGNHLWQGGNGISALGSLIYIGTGDVNGVIITGNQIEGTLSNQIYIDSTTGQGPRNINITGNDFWQPSPDFTDNSISTVFLNGGGNMSQITYTGNTILGVDNTHRFKSFIDSAGAGARTRIVVTSNTGNLVVQPFSGFTPAGHYANSVWNGSATVESENKGVSTQSGNGSATAFTIAHGVAGTPTTFNVTPSSADASGQFYVTANATNLTVTYTVAPPNGTNNLTLAWQASL